MFRDSLVGVQVPEFPDGLTWFNSNALRMADLRGKVVLVDFWTYSCVNCIRTLPYLKKWHERYKDFGLVIIGVHTPEFAFEKDGANVERALKDFGITYPVILDNEYAVWNAYNNNVWPRKLLVSQEGVIVYDHAGEGAYGRTEREIQTLLRKMNPDASFPAPDNDEGEGGVCYPTTGELYLGYMRGRVGNPRTYFRKEEAHLFNDSQEYKAHQWYLEGEWSIAKEYIEHTRKTENAVDYIALRFSALEVNIVMESPKGPRGLRFVTNRLALGQIGKLRFPANRSALGEIGSPQPAEVEILLDSAKPYALGDKKPVELAVRGKDVREREGHTFAEVSHPRMINLVSSKELIDGVLTIAIKEKGVRAYAFTFGGCM